ncbi:MAG: hypothetical protein ACTSRQ_06630 [Candidatus Thorarchaeota archaeon]
MYEAYQMTSGLIMVFMIPIFLPMIGLETGNVGDLVWVSNFTTLIISVLIFTIGWALALKLFNRDKLVSMV